MVSGKVLRALKGATFSKYLFTEFWLPLGLITIIIIEIIMNISRGKVTIYSVFGIVLGFKLLLSCELHSNTLFLLNQWGN